MLNNVPIKRPIGEYANEPLEGDYDAKRVYGSPDPLTGAYDASQLRWGFVISDCGLASYARGGVLEVPRDLAVGTVMGLWAGRPVPLDFTATGGPQIPCRILIAPERAAVNATRSWRLLSCDALVLGSQLQWPSGATPDQIAAAVALLRQNNRIEIV